MGRLLAELWRGGWAYRYHPGRVGVALVLAMVAHAGFVMVFYLSARALNPPESLPSVAAHFLLVPLGMILSLGVPTPGGIGGGEFVYGSLYELAGFSFAAGLLASMMRRIISWGVGLGGYLVVMHGASTLASRVAAEGGGVFAGYEWGSHPDEQGGSGRRRGRVPPG